MEGAFGEGEQKIRNTQCARSGSSTVKGKCRLRCIELKDRIKKHFLPSHVCGRVEDIEIHFVRWLPIAFGCPVSDTFAQPCAEEGGGSGLYLE